MEDVLKKYESYQVDDKTQQKLNQPLKDKTGFNEGHEEFLKTLIQKLEKGDLDSHKPATLYNRAIYDKLPEEEQEKADLTAINLMSMIRQIESLWKIDQSATFQIQNLVESVFQMKSKFEQQYGDVYII
ncbi:hypothetical protein JXD20_02935 [Candidatus Peregrinibacteria bacterium]|nr:hypothetical protein [Candidatus Peregrinibacteria bacterium]